VSLPLGRLKRIRRRDGKGYKERQEHTEHRFPFRIGEV
jgi:hypothetical protein